MSSQITNNNTYTTAPASPNPYIFRKLNNMDQVQVMKREREDWLRLYHKTLKGLETMIDVQRLVKNIKKLVEEANTMITEVERSVLTASINNWVTNTTNITQILEDLWYIVQSDMDEQAFQVQRMLANELDQYKGKGNKYVDDNIQEIQDLYMEKEKKEEKGVVESEEVILVRLYEISSTTSSLSGTSFITDEVKNLLKYMKFVKTPSQTRIFRPCHIQVHLSIKLHPCGDATSEPYKPAFHGGHLSCNMSYGDAATLRVFRLLRRRYSYSTQSSMTELLLSVSQHWNLRSG